MNLGKPNEIGPCRRRQNRNFEPGFFLILILLLALKKNARENEEQKERSSILCLDNKATITNDCGLLRKKMKNQYDYGIMRRSLPAIASQE